MTQHNSHRNQQTNRTNSGHQYNNRYQQQDPNRYRRSELERELRFLHRRLSDLDGKIDALKFTGLQMEADLHAHQFALPSTIAWEVGRALANALHVPFLPPAGRTWYYKRQAILQAMDRLKYRAIELKYQRDALPYEQ